jgi:hypothetical protein
MRSIAAFGILQARTKFFLTVSPVCGRRNEVKWKCSLRNWNAAEWSGRKVASQSSGTGGSVPMLGARNERKCRLGEATGKKLKTEIRKGERE